MLGNHILATTMSGMPILFIGGRGSAPSGRLANLLHHMSSKYGNNVYAHGVLLGSTLMMGLIMHVMSSYYGGVSRCVTKSHAAWINGDGGHALTGGYANDDDDSISSSSTTTTTQSATSANFDPWGNCGTPVGTTARRQITRNRLVFIAECRHCARVNRVGRKHLAIF